MSPVTSLKSISEIILLGKKGNRNYFFKILFIYVLEREYMQAGGGTEREEEGEGGNLKRTPCSVWSPEWGLISQP